MSYEKLLTIPATITTRTISGTDRYGTVTHTDTNVSTKCGLDQLSSSERGPDEIDAEKCRLYLRAGVVITDQSTVTANGKVFQVDGTPWEVVDARKGTVHHIEAILRRTA